MDSMLFFVMPKLTSPLKIQFHIKYDMRLFRIDTVFMYKLVDEIVGFYEDSSELFHEPDTRLVVVSHSVEEVLHVLTLTEYFVHQSTERLVADAASAPLLVDLDTNVGCGRIRLG